MGRRVILQYKYRNKREYKEDKVFMDMASALAYLRDELKYPANLESIEYIRFEMTRE